MTYNVLKSIDLTNFMNSLVCFLVSCSYGGGQVSPVWVMAFRRILLSFSSFFCVRVCVCVCVGGVGTHAGMFIPLKTQT
jgi:hypothetical protein